MKQTKNYGKRGDNAKATRVSFDDKTDWAYNLLLRIVCACVCSSTSQHKIQWGCVYKIMQKNNLYVDR